MTYKELVEQLTEYLKKNPHVKEQQAIFIDDDKYCEIDCLWINKDEHTHLLNNLVLSSSRVFQYVYE